MHLLLTFLKIKQDANLIKFITNNNKLIRYNEKTLHLLF